MKKIVLLSLVFGMAGCATTANFLIFIQHLLVIQVIGLVNLIGWLGL